jgi:hypothetical protein
MRFYTRSQIHTKSGYGMSALSVTLRRGILISRLLSWRGQMDVMTFTVKNILPHKLYRFNSMFSMMLRVKG